MPAVCDIGEAETEIIAPLYFEWNVYRRCTDIAEAPPVERFIDVERGLIAHVERVGILRKPEQPASFSNCKLRRVLKILDKRVAPVDDARFLLPVHKHPYGDFEPVHIVVHADEWIGHVVCNEVPHRHDAPTPLRKHHVHVPEVIVLLVEVVLILVVQEEINLLVGNPE